ncbi:MAG TPA: RNA methyltransferase [Chitinivibrionales bacterium]|nr:RNA methyltransferase [Chitinivibrionales bacterium]
MKPLSFYKSLHDVKGRRAENAFLIEGVRAITQISQTSPQSILELIIQEKESPPKNLRYPIRAVTASQFRGISASTTPPGIIAVVTIPKDAYSSTLPENKGSRVLALEDVQDPGNVGTLIRTAAAFDFSGVLLSEKCSDPFGPKAVQASMGSVMSLWVRKTKAFGPQVMQLGKEGFCCVAADVHGKVALHAVDEPKLMLLLGNEGSGISAQTLGLAHQVARIPMNEKKAESLNVAASGAICMYVLTKR